MVTPARPAASCIIVPKKMSSLAVAPFRIHIYLLCSVFAVVWSWSVFLLASPPVFMVLLSINIKSDEIDILILHFGRHCAAYLWLYDD